MQKKTIAENIYRKANNLNIDTLYNFTSKFALKQLNNPILIVTVSIKKNNTIIFPNEINMHYGNSYILIKLKKLDENVFYEYIDMSNYINYIAEIHTVLLKPYSRTLKDHLLWFPE